MPEKNRMMQLALRRITAIEYFEDEKKEAEQKLEKMSQEIENVYQSKVKEKLQKLEENKQNASLSKEKFIGIDFVLAFEN